MQNIKIIFLGFLGAMVFHFIQIRFFPTANAVESKIISASAFNFVDSHGNLRGQFGFAKEGPPGFWLMDEKGTSRLAMGLYTDGTAHLGLQDRQGQMIQLMRSFGSQEAPLLIFKNHGADAMIMGLNPGDITPFVMHYDSQRKRKLEFGKYDGP